MAHQPETTSQQPRADGPAHSTPPIFVPLSLADARAAAQQQNRLLILDITAQTCAPCRLMDQSTWQDAAVVDWIHQHALAIQLDADRDAESIRGLWIWALPTVIIFSGETELDRLRGYHSGADLLKRLERARERDAQRR